MFSLGSAYQTAALILLLLSTLAGCRLFSPDDDLSEYKPLPKAGADDINNVETRRWSD
jgi:hypothetical protein